MIHEDLPIGSYTLEDGAKRQGRQGKDLIVIVYLKPATKFDQSPEESSSRSSSLLAQHSWRRLYTRGPTNNDKTDALHAFRANWSNKYFTQLKDETFFWLCPFVFACGSIHILRNGCQTFLIIPIQDAKTQSGTLEERTAVQGSTAKEYSPSWSHLSFKVNLGPSSCSLAFTRSFNSRGAWGSPSFVGVFLAFFSSKIYLWWRTNM